MVGGPHVLAALRVVAGIGALAGAAAAQPASEFSAWTDSGFADAEQRMLSSREIYPQAAPALPLSFDATVLFARGTAWSEARAIRQIRLTAAVFAKCRVALGRIRLVRLRLPAEQRRIDASAPESRTGVPRNVSALAGLLPAGAARPAAFLLGRIDGSDSPAVSYRPVDGAATGAPHLNTAWIGYRAHWLPRADAGYSPLAHEFAHLLCRCGHVHAPDRHLLHSARNFLSATVLPEHCELIHQSPLVASND